MRGHGPAGDYRGRYPDATPRDWARRIASARAAGRAVHVYFDNDIDAHAPRDAARLRTMIDAQEAC